MRSLRLDETRDVGDRESSSSEAEAEAPAPEEVGILPASGRPKPVFLYRGESDCDGDLLVRSAFHFALGEPLLLRTAPALPARAGEFDLYLDRDLAPYGTVLMSSLIIFCCSKPLSALEAVPLSD